MSSYLLSTGCWIGAALFQLKTLTGADLAPNWYDAGTGKSRKRKVGGSSSTKDLEKKKKAAMAVEADDEVLGDKAPIKR